MDQNLKNISKNDVEAFVTPNGEIIYEILGRGTFNHSEKHSVAHIVLPKGKASLLHYHPVAEESYYILKGKGNLKLGDKEMSLERGQCILIPSPVPHKISNAGEEDLEFLAICTPAWEVTNTVWLEK